MSHYVSRLVKRSAALVTFGAAVALAPVAMAEDDYAITYTDSELRSFSGVERVHKKIMKAAKRYCPTYSQIRSNPEVKACIEDVANDLVSKVNHPRLTSFHVNDGSIRVADTHLKADSDRG